VTLAVLRHPGSLPPSGCPRLPVSYPSPVYPQTTPTNSPSQALRHQKCAPRQPLPAWAGNLPSSGVPVTGERMVGVGGTQSRSPTSFSLLGSASHRSWSLFSLDHSLFFCLCPVLFSLSLLLYVLPYVCLAPQSLFLSLFQAF
jgi:hypothetical protein